MLLHLNRDFGFDFDVDAYSHRAHYDEDEGRIEIHLVSSGDQVVSSGDEAFAIRDGESILTEYSHKYTIDGFAAMADRAGFHVEKVWTDAEELFSVQYCERQ
jgi:uncharacterized SAM-dependent methyltransferase